MGETSAIRRGSQDYRKSVLTVITCSLLHLVSVNSIAFCIPITTSFGGADADTILNRSHFALAWIQVIPLLFWIPITRATWTGTSSFARSPRNAAIGMSWLLRSFAVLNLIAFAYVFVERVLEPNARTTIAGTVSSLLYSIFWLICLVFLFGIFRKNRVRNYVTFSAALLIYYIVNAAIIQPKLASFFGALTGPYSLNLFVLVHVSISTFLAGIFAGSLAYLGYKSIPLVRSLQ